MLNIDPPGLGAAAAPTPQRLARCPTCRRTCAWHSNPQRPFCSLTCRLIDLGTWLDDGYVVQDDPSDDVR